MADALLVGTKKGLFVVRDGEAEGPLLPGWSIYHAIADPRDGTLFAASNHFVYGATVHRSSDRGRTWERAESLGLPEDGELKLNATWHVEPADDAVWLGGDPGVLFRSDDGGVTFEPVRGLVEHPTRDRWQPGAGGMCCHSIQLADGRIYAAISAAGAFRSDDGGETWTPINQGVAADFFPDNPFPEVGQCVHKLLAHPARPGRLWQQNHCGVYRTDDYGDSWERLEGNGLPSGFGFPIALDPADPDVAYVVPEEGAENRVTCDGRLGVYRTADGGASWTLEQDGLPQSAWLAVLREGLAWDGDGVYLGAQSGSVFARRDGTWSEVARHLPPILSIEAAAWS
jgi:BNR/Asp-box repeat